MAAVTGILLSNTLPAFAYTDEAAAQETPAEQTAPAETVPETEAPVVEETPTAEAPENTTEATPFSVPGNGQLLDDKSNDDTKQFLTIQTKNGNTFFMVLDRSSNTENVYMLSMIDENDLAEFVEKTETETPSVVIPETETKPDEPETKEEPEKTEEKSTNMGGLLAIVLLLAGGIGGYYYFKVLKPKKEEEAAEDEDLEFLDEGAYINEDQELSPDEDEDGEE